MRRLALRVRQRILPHRDERNAHQQIGERVATQADEREAATCEEIEVKIEGDESKIDARLETVGPSRPREVGASLDVVARLSCGVLQARSEGRSARAGFLDGRSGRLRGDALDAERAGHVVALVFLKDPGAKSVEPEADVRNGPVAEHEGHAGRENLTAIAIVRAEARDVGRIDERIKRVEAGFVRKTVTCEPLPACADAIDFHRNLIAVRTSDWRHRCESWSPCLRIVRCRIEPGQRSSGLAHGLRRKPVAGNGRPGSRVEELAAIQTRLGIDDTGQQTGEIAVPPGVRRHRRDSRERFSDPLPFIVAERKPPLPLQRTAHSRAELVALKLWHVPRGIVECVPGI